MNRFKRFWLSWNEKNEDVRPLTFPPNPAVLGWWCTGEAGDDSYSTMVAWVEARNESEAKVAVLKDWPGNHEWRFVEECALDWFPNERFPLSDWSKKRISRSKTPLLRYKLEIMELKLELEKEKEANVLLHERIKNILLVSDNKPATESHSKKSLPT